VAIKSIKSKALKKFWLDNDESKVQPNHIDILDDILTMLESSHSPKDIKKSFRSFEEKKGSGSGTYTIQVNGNWRVTFQIENEGAVLVDYKDYHGKQIRTKK